MNTISRADLEDADAILLLQRLAFRSVGEWLGNHSIPPLTQTRESLLEEFAAGVVLKTTSDGRVIGSVRARLVDGRCAIGRLMVQPDRQGEGIGSRLLESIESHFPLVEEFELFTGSSNEKNIGMYMRRGFEQTRIEEVAPGVLLTHMVKSRRRWRGNAEGDARLAPPRAMPMLVHRPADAPLDTSPAS